MTKKKAKSKPAAKKPAKKTSPAKAKAETNPAEVRKEVSKLVEANATGMAQAVIDEGMKGQLAPVKYLFEMASIFPPTPNGEQATTEEDCLAKMLLDRIGPEKKPAEEEGSEGGGAMAEARLPKNEESDCEGAAELRSARTAEGGCPYTVVAGDRDTAPGWGSQNPRPVSPKNSETRTGHPSSPPDGDTVE